MKTVAQHKKFFLSLKWKAFLSTSLVLSAIFGLLAYSQHYYLKQQFEKSREDAYARYIRQFNGLIDQAYSRIQQLAGTVISVEGMEEAIASKDEEKLHAAFDNFWWRLSLDSEIHTAAIYDDLNVSLARWDVPNVPEELVEEVNATEEPSKRAKCWLTCELYIAVPVLVSDGNSSSKNGGVVVLGAPLNKVIKNFETITGTHAAVVVSIEQHEMSLAARFIPEWNVNIADITHAPDEPVQNNITILRKAAKRFSLKNIEKKAITFENEVVTLPQIPGEEETIDITYTELRLIRLKNLNFITLADVTNDYEKLQEALRERAAFSIIGLLIAELLVLFILWNPMTRLRMTSEYLPYLAQNSFEKARIGLSRLNRTKNFQDESDILNSTAIALSHQLEGLQVQLHRRAEQLQERGRELEAERDFVTGLLNTAHALILTQDVDGRVLMINRHGEWITGYTSEEISGKMFTTLLPHNELLPDLNRQLEDLIIGKRFEHHHEADLITKDGESLHMAWYHSSLSDKGTHKHKILTIGLDISERKQAEDNLGWLASHDSLTGLFNRRRFSEDLSRIIETNQRYHRISALLFFDLDQFKDVNDTSGHHVGDTLLKRVAEVLRNTARESDIIARLGGDEFAVIIQEIELSTLPQTAERFCQELASIQITGKNQVHRVSASIGVSLIPDHGRTVEEILANADIAMYQAKESGRNGWHLFDDREHGKERIHERVYWNEKVKQALNEDLLNMYYQPVVDIATGEIKYFEALLRVFDEDNKPFPADKIITAAERSGLIQEMDERIIEKVIAQKASLEIRGIDTRLSINLSGLSFKNKQLLNHIKKCMSQFDVDPASIIFEITETAAVADVGATSEIMTGIKKLGCKFALDDFGVGFSSLYYLKQLPIDYIKIDGSFIKNLHNQPDDQVLVKALVEVARAFGHHTVAEYVEYKETLDLLNELGVDLAQGYYINHPQPVDTIWDTTL